MTTTNKPKTLTVKRLASFALALVFAFLLATPVPTVYAVETTTKKYSEDDPEVQALKNEIAGLDAEIAASKEKQQALEAEMDAASASASSIQSQADELQKQIDAYNVKIYALNKQITNLNNQITSIENSIAETEQKMVEQDQKIKETQKLLADRMRATYMSGNVSKIEIIMESDSFESLLNRLELVSQVAKHDNQIIVDLQNQVKELTKLKKELAAQKDQLEGSKKEIEASKSEVVAAKNEIASKKSVLDSKLNQLEKYLNSLSADNKELIAYQKNAEARQDAFDAQIFRMLNGIASTGDGSLAGGMIWPVTPSSGTSITSGYGYRSLTSNFHKGIDIAGSGANSSGNYKIIAAATGVVIKVYNSCNHNYPKTIQQGYNDPHYSTYGNSVFIDHGNGVITRYGHLGNVSVWEGQTVTAGQKLGTMGCTGCSTGFHLHFEVRVNGDPVNPMNYGLKR